ncbi:MAG: hypothetical protein OXE50_15030, partial [Chloroflexi bacterium]|nr:hypothetical protein [Chloroflexota bacterium]
SGRSEQPISRVGIYVPCNTPLIHRAEYELLDDFRGTVLSEHYFALAIGHALVATLEHVPNVMDGANDEMLRGEVNGLLGSELSETLPLFAGIRTYLNRELLETQRAMNKPDDHAFYENTFSFASVVVPLMHICAKDVPKLAGTHFLLLIDDAHVLNPGQTRCLNSWIAYRDHSLFSFKVATAKGGTRTKTPATGGVILEGHDYTTIDLEAPYVNKGSNFYHLASRLIKKRLERIGVSATPEEFFPLNESMSFELEKFKEIARKEAEQKYDDSKSISDYVYKYARAMYFRSLSSKANRPPYSGFETLVFLSTGVVRNLLEPCYWMFDDALSELDSNLKSDGHPAIELIPAEIQTRVILRLSERIWGWLENDIARDIEDCNSEDGNRAFQLLDALAGHFRERLKHHKSEPRALSFTISERDSALLPDLLRIVEILRRAQLIYIRRGPAKDKGRREEYFIPNRILWPIRGLDPIGQHARVSIRASVLWSAAESGVLPLADANREPELWDED